MSPPRQGSPLREATARWDEAAVEARARHARLPRWRWVARARAGAQLAEARENRAFFERMLSQHGSVESNHNR